MSEPASPFKGKTGLQRILNAAGYSWDGLNAAFRHEDAFRQEVFLALLLIPLALYLGETGMQRALMIAAVLGVLIVELLNSAIEAAVDRISLEHHHAHQARQGHGQRSRHARAGERRGRLGTGAAGLTRHKIRAIFAPLPKVARILSGIQVTFRFLYPREP